MMSFSSELWLCRLREFTNPLCTQYYRRNLTRALRAEQRTLADAGVSTAELNRLCVEGYRRAALYGLEIIHRRLRPLLDQDYLLFTIQSLDRARLSDQERLKADAILELLRKGRYEVAPRMEVVLNVPNQWKEGLSPAVVAA